MKNASPKMSVLVCGVMLLWACSVHAQDWPQWRGPNRDNKVVGFSTPQMWPKALTQKWKVTVGLGDASPDLVEGRIDDDDVGIRVNRGVPRAPVARRIGDDACRRTEIGVGLLSAHHAGRHHRPRETGAAGDHPAPRHGFTTKAFLHRFLPGASISEIVDRLALPGQPSNPSNRAIRREQTLPSLSWSEVAVAAC